MNKHNVFMHKVEYCSALKRKKILQYATTRVNLEGIMRKPFHLSEVLRIVKIIMSESKMEVERVWEEEKMEFLFNMCRISVLQVKKSLGELDDGDGFTTR